MALATLGDAASEHWTQVDELLATNIEVTHVAVRLLVALNNAWSTNKSQIPDVLRVRRPHERPRATTWGQAARRMLQRRGDR